MSKTIKNYSFLLLGIIYFSFYFYNKNASGFVYFRESITYGTEILSYITAIIWGFTCLGVIGIANRILKNTLETLSKKTENWFDDVLSHFLTRFISVAKYIAAIYIGFSLAILPGYIQDVVEKISSISILIIFLVFLTSFVNLIFQKELILKSKMKAVSKHLLPFINKMIVVFIWVIWAITIIGNLGYDVSALVAGAWIGGLAIALAAQKSLTNVFGAITIMLNKPFKIGDYITLQGHTGTVTDIGLSYLTIRDKMGHQVMIPNENIISSSIENLSVRSNRRTDFSIGLVYGTSLEDMKKWVSIIEDILASYVEQETVSSYRVNFDMFGDFSLNINATYFSLITSDYVEYIKQKEEINLEIKNKFEKAKLDMAFPTQELILKKES